MLTLSQCVHRIDSSMCSSSIAVSGKVAEKAPPGRKKERERERERESEKNEK